MLISAFKHTKLHSAKNMKHTHIQTHTHTHTHTHTIMRLPVCFHVKDKVFILYDAFYYESDDVCVVKVFLLQQLLETSRFISTL